MLTKEAEAYGHILSKIVREAICEVRVGGKNRRSIDIIASGQVLIKECRDPVPLGHSLEEGAIEGGVFVETDVYLNKYKQVAYSQDHGSPLDTTEPIRGIPFDI
jgi:hypothetical protein